MAETINNINREANHAEVSHDHTLYAETIFKVGGFPVTNSLINTWLVVLIVLALSWTLRSRLKLVPRGIQNFFESIIEVFLDLFDSVTGSRQKSLKFFPFVFAFFFFILLNNWLGILPGIGSIGLNAAEDGHSVFVPFFRGGTADLNTTLALATIAVVASHIFGVIALGAWNHFNKFINLKAILAIPKAVKAEPAVLIVNPIKLVVGLIEIISELAKVASLSFRLFGNIFAGEVLLASMSAILAFGLPIPFMFLEVMVGAIQALVFAMLALSYLTMSTAPEEH
ncbi:MAG: F0F1 ATP synthase subunit A [Planctomycetes bacterium]|jgi:F-type H+-transporting ATPase subunit a|nr:F0F1 ATP synthase subunit A [Planctomycetota bacterium]